MSRYDKCDVCGSQMTGFTTLFCPKCVEKLDETFNPQPVAQQHSSPPTVPPLFSMGSKVKGFNPKHAKPVNNSSSAPKKNSPIYTYFSTSIPIIGPNGTFLQDGTLWKSTAGLISPFYYEVTFVYDVKTVIPTLNPNSVKLTSMTEIIQIKVVKAVNPGAGNYMIIFP